VAGGEGAWEMAKGTMPDMTRESRHVYGPRPIGALIPGVTRAAFRRRAPGTAQVMADWVAIVGPVLAAATLPRRLSGGTLTIACSGPVAMELQHLSRELIQRINTVLGAPVVKVLRFTQVTLAASPAVSAAAPVSPEVALRAESAVEGFSDTALRAALTALGRAVFGAAAQRSRHPRNPGDKFTRY
jgi:hypothetical protein